MRKMSRLFMKLLPLSRWVSGGACSGTAPASSWLERKASVKLIGLCLPLLLFSTCWAGELKNGIYACNTAGAGERVKRNDGAEVILGQRLGHAFGTATIRSVKNDNSLFVVHLKGAGPLADEAGYLAVVVEGICLGVWGRSDRNADGTVDLSCSIRGEKMAQKVATYLKAPLQLRKNPGHRFDVRWSPDKESYQSGDAVALTMEIRNVGNKPFTFRVGGQQRGARDNQFRFLAYRSGGDGKAVPDTGDPSNSGGKASCQTLNPGEAFKKSVTLDRWLTLTDPDTYRITGLFELELHDPLLGVAIWDDLAAGDSLVRIIPKS